MTVHRIALADKKNRLFLVRGFDYLPSTCRRRRVDTRLMGWQRATEVVVAGVARD